MVFEAYAYLAAAFRKRCCVVKQIQRIAFRYIFGRNACAVSIDCGNCYTDFAVLNQLFNVLDSVRGIKHGILLVEFGNDAR